MKRINKEEKITRKNVLEFINEAIAEKKYDSVFEFQRRFKVKGVVISKTRLLNEYKELKNHLDKLTCREFKNPRFSNSNPMILFILTEVKEFQKNMH